MYNVEAKLQPTEYNARSTNHLSAAEIYPSKCELTQNRGSREAPSVFGNDDFCMLWLCDVMVRPSATNG